MKKTLFLSKQLKKREILLSNSVLAAFKTAAFIYLKRGLWLQKFVTKF